MKLGLKTNKWSFSLERYGLWFIIGMMLVCLFSYLWWDSDIKDALFAIFLSTILGWRLR